MKLVQLLSGAAAVALIAGAAQAQTVAATGDIADDTVFASEYNNSIAGDTLLTVDLDAGAGPFLNVGAAGVVQATVTLTNLRFPSVVTSAAFTSVGVVAACNFDVVAGGGALGNSVTIQNTAQLNTCNADGLWTLPLERVAAGPASLTVSYACTSDCGTFAATSNSFDLIREIDAYEAANQSVTAAVAAATLNATGIGPAAPFALGEVDYSLRDSGDPDGAGPLGVLNINVDQTPLVAAGFSQIVAADAATSAELVVTFPSGITGVASVAAVGVAGACVGNAVANTFTCPVTAGELALLNGVGQGAISFTPDNVGQVALQTPTAALNVTANAGYALNSVGAANLAAIEYDDGLNTDVPVVGNSFEWVSVRSSGGTDSAFRVTGLPTDLSATGACIEVQSTNTNTTIANTGWNCISGASVTASADNTWTATFRSADVNAALGSGEGNADINLRVRRADTINSVVQADNAFNAQINVRRVLSRNDIVTGTGFDG